MSIRKYASGYEKVKQRKKKNYTPIDILNYIKD